MKRLSLPHLSLPRLAWPQGSPIGRTGLTALVAVASVVVLLAGCATPGEPTPRLAETAPAAIGLNDTTSAAAPARWWATLGDPQLSGLVDQALRDQPSLAVAQARVARARAVAGITKAAASSA